jgi:DNA polymerase I
LNSDEEEALVSDIWPAEVPLEKTEVCFVQSLDDLNRMMRWLGEKRDILAVDTESAGLDPWAPDARIRLIQFGDVNTAWAVDAVRWPGIIYDVLENYQGKIALHNMGFDAKYLQIMFPDLKFPWHLCVDTMILAKLEHNLRSAKLKGLCEQRFGPAATMGQRVLENGMSKNNWTWNTVPLDFAPYSVYAAIDCILTARLYRTLSHIETGPGAYICELEHDVQRISTGMEMHGLRVDRAYCESKRAELVRYVEEIKKFCEKEYGVAIGSTMQLGKWFLDYEKEHGVRLLTEYTNTGRPQMDKDVLDTLAEYGFEVATHAVKMRKAEKLSGSFFANLLKFSDMDGLIHPQINAMQAKTGRQSIVNPALQTIPADSGGMVRRAFVPHDGCTIFTADYSSVEMRLTGHFYGDQILREVFEESDSTGTKFFTLMGRRIFGPDFGSHDPRYKLVKNTSYASAYGAGVDKMASMAKVPVGDMRDVAEAIFNEYLSIKGLQKKCMDEAMQAKREFGEASVLTPFGRRLYLEPGKDYAASNMKVQGHAAELLKQATRACDQKGLGPFLTLTIHDEIMFNVPKEYDPVEVINEIKECMEVTKEMGYLIPIPVAPQGPMDRWDTKD